MIARLTTLVLFLIMPVTHLVAGQTFLFGEDLSREWPNTDFDKTTVDLSEIFSGGPPRDGIPPIDDPRFASVTKTKGISGTEPVISIEINGTARAYPFRILIWHEVVNDEIEGVPITITFCPLCNAAIVFDRELDGRIYDFGTTGRLRNSDLVMWDRQTESWWQQFTGEAIVGEMAGARLKKRPARIESYNDFKKRHPEGEVLQEPARAFRPYGLNPYELYDSMSGPFFAIAEMPDNISAMARVVSVDDRAWALNYVRGKGRIETEDGLIITWHQGQNSALDHRLIDEGRDVGTILVQRKTAGGLEDVVYGVDFAFAFHAFYPESEIIVE